MEPDSLTVPKRTLTEILYVVFLRLVAVACFWFGLQYWAMLVGYSLKGMARFDLLTLPWKVAASSLAVLFPVASLGLWLTVSWGPVLWAIAAISQVSMYIVWPEIFGPDAERRQDLDEARRTFEAMAAIYPAYGYELIELPRASVEARAAFVLDRLDT